MTQVTIDGLLSFDPGEVHVGVALFERILNPATDRGWACIDAMEVSPERAADVLVEHLGQYRDRTSLTVCWEAWNLDPSKLRELTGSECETAQLIGVFKHILRKENETRLSFPGGNEGPQVPWYQIDRQVKTPTASMLRECGRKSVAVKRKQGGHAKDAELTGWSWLIRQLKIDPGTGLPRKAASA